MKVPSTLMPPADLNMRAEFSELTFGNAHAFLISYHSLALRIRDVI